MTQEDYQRMRNTAVNCNADIYRYIIINQIFPFLHTQILTVSYINNLPNRPYKDATEYRDKFCLPPIQIVSEDEIICPLQSMLNHQVTKVFQVEKNLKNNVVIFKQNNPLADLVLVFDYGMQYLPITLQKSVVYAL